MSIKPYLEMTEGNVAALEAFATNNGQPIVMVNLMQVRATAEYGDAARNDCSGSDAFARYTQGSSEVRQQAGVKLGWSGGAIQLSIGPTYLNLGHHRYFLASFSHGPHHGCLSAYF